MNVHHEDFLVIGTVEDADASPLRKLLLAAPEVVVVQILGGGRLKRSHLATLRVYARHYMSDRAILSSGVHRLKNEQHSPAVLGIEHVLQSGESLHSDVQSLFSTRLVRRFQVAGVVGIDIFQTKPLAIGDAVRESQFASLLNNFVEFHGETLSQPDLPYRRRADKNDS